MRIREITSLALASMLALSSTVQVFAEGTTQEPSKSEAVLTAQAANFNVTVPSQLPIDVDQNNNVTVATDVKLNNLSHGPIRVVSIGIEPINSWVKVDTVSNNVNKKEFELVVGVRDAVVPSKSSTDIIYTSAVSPQKSEVNEVIALVNFLVDWSEDIAGESTVDKYVLATDADFSGTTDGSFRYIGTDKYVEIPHVIKGIPVTSYANMFNSTSVEGVKSTNKNVTNMSGMFSESQATSLDLSSFNTSNVIYMSSMFSNSQTTEIRGLSNFNTSNVTHMNSMFAYSQATSLDLSSFDTSNVTNMNSMFSSLQATVLDLSSFNTSNVTNMGYMFSNSSATTGYARTQADADKFNNSSYKPAILTFVVK